MKKLILILLCLSLVYSCHKKQKTVDKKPIKENIKPTINLVNISALIEIREIEKSIVYNLNNAQSVDNEISILKSYNLTEKTLKSLGRDISITKEYIDKLNIRRPYHNSSLIRISLEADTLVANEMVEYLNKLIELYAQSNLEAKHLLCKNRIDSITKSILVVEDSLVLLENQIQDYRSKAIINNKYNIIYKKFENYEKQCEYFLSKLAEARIECAGLTSSVKVIDPAKIDDIVKFLTYSEVMEVLSVDGFQIKIDLSFRYNPIPDKIAYLHDKVGKDYLEKIIKPEIRSLTREIVGNYEAVELNSKVVIKSIEEEISEKAKNSLKSKFIILDVILIKDISLP